MNSRKLLAGLSIFIWMAVSTLANAQNYVQLINSQKLLQDGIELYEDKNYEKAMDLYKKVPQGDTNYFAAQYEYTLCLYKLERYEEVVKESKRLIAEGTEELSQYNIWGSALDDLKRREEALTVYNMAIEKFPYSTNLWLNKGLVYEAMEDYQHAFETYQKLLEISPLYPSAHLRLAYLAEREGRLTQAIMAFSVFLTLEPDSKRSLDVIDEFNKLCNQSSSIIGSAKTKVLPNEFEDLDFIVANQVALNSKYKIPGKMKYPVNRQIHLVMEKLAGSSNYEAGFYSKTYLDFFNDFLKTKSFEHFSLLILASSDNETISKELKKNMEGVKKTRNQCLEKLSSMHPTKTFVYNGVSRNLTYFYYNNFNVEALGTQNATGKNTGFWIFFDNTGFIEAIGEYNATGMKDGRWIFFNAKGDTIKSLTYKNNLAEGPYVIYRNGRPKEAGNYAKDELEGWICEYFPDGTLKTRDYFTNGKRNGEGATYYANGVKNYEYTFAQGEPSGGMKEYYNHGALKEESAYKMGKTEGLMKQYHENKQVAKECNFVNDQLEGPFKTYYSNGKVEKEGTCVKGSMSGKWITYYSDGSIKEISYLDENGKVNGEEESYDHRGHKYRIDNYTKGDWKRVQYIDKDGKVIYDTRIAKTGTVVVGFDEHLDKAVEGMIKENEREGLWTFYLPNGDVESTENYKKGKLDGESKTFHKNGTVAGIYHYKNGERDGLEVKFHENGNLASEGNYMNGDKFGIWREYANDGTLTSWEFYHYGDKRGWTYDYQPNGNVYKKHFYKNGVLLQIQACDTSGNVIDTAYLPNGTGKVELKGLSGKKTYEGNFVNGIAHGPATWFFPDGKLNTKGEYFMGYRHGEWVYYHPNGKVANKIKYFYGDPEGDWEYFSYHGEMVRKFPYRYAKNTGKNIWFYDNGKPESEIGYYEEERHGESRYYAQTGELREVRYYDFGKLIGYTYLGKNGKLVDTIFLKNGDGVVKTYYQNGNLSTQFELKAGAYHGSYKIYYPDGKLQEERMYVTGEEYGTSKKYFPDGKVKRIENNLSGQTHGEVIEYNANGTLKFREHYVNNNLHGLCEYFDINGKRIHAYIYVNDDLVTIIQ